MTAITFAFVTFVCTFSCALAATFIRSWLPPSHLSKESQDIVRLGIGLVATMTALLLGLVTAAARSAFDSQDAALRNSAANILTLDRILARYGPETKPTRDLIRSAVAFRLATIWPAEGGGGLRVDTAESSPPVEEIENQILRLSPENDTQRWFKSEALKLSEEIVKTRWRALGAAGGGSDPVSYRGDLLVDGYIHQLWSLCAQERDRDRGALRRGRIGRGSDVPDHGAGRSIRRRDQMCRVPRSDSCLRTSVNKP